MQVLHTSVTEGIWILNRCAGRHGRASGDAQNVTIAHDFRPAVSSEQHQVADASNGHASMMKVDVALHVRPLFKCRGIDEPSRRMLVFLLPRDARDDVPVRGKRVLEPDLDATVVERHLVAVQWNWETRPIYRGSSAREMSAVEVSAVERRKSESNRPWNRPGFQPTIPATRNRGIASGGSRLAAGRNTQRDRQDRQQQRAKKHFSVSFLRATPPGPPIQRVKNRTLARGSLSCAGAGDGGERLTNARETLQLLINFFDFLDGFLLHLGTCGFRIDTQSQQVADFPQREPEFLRVPNEFDPPRDVLVVPSKARGWTGAVV